MRPDDKYRAMGFKCGLEIHQQLLTTQKLFCRCPAGYRNDPPHGEIVRHMRPTLSELGEYDGTALMEFKTRKNVIYQLYRDSACTYEMDDTPPFPINRQALEIALKLGMLLNCAIVDELHVSRKQYLDGSIPTGFQRTAIVGVGGWIPYKGRKITITHICLEEDACREVLDSGHDIIFRTDRLSTPLLEVITAPEMLTPTEAMEVDAIIGRILKASGLVRRGIGSVRQDVNVSIAGGERVEIKGVAQTWMIEELTAIEAERQAALLKIRDTLKQRGITDKSVKSENFDLSRILSGCGIGLIENAIAQNQTVNAIRLDGFAGIFNTPVQPGKTFADEIAGRLKVIACLDKYPNLAVSDIPEMAGFNSVIWQKIQAGCGCKPSDAVIVTWGSHSDVATALSEIKLRAIDAVRGVPNETRQPLKNGITDFERILPGADRMYPDTDSPPVEISAEFLDRLRSALPEKSYNTEERWIKKGVPKDIAEKAVVSRHSELFDSIINSYNTPPEIVWGALKRLNQKDNSYSNEDNAQLLRLFEKYQNGELSKDSFFDILQTVDFEKDGNIDNLIKERKLLDIKEAAVQSIISEFVRETEDCLFKRPDDRIGYICGRIKERLKGRIDGKQLQQEVANRIR